MSAPGHTASATTAFAVDTANLRTHVGLASYRVCPDLSALAGGWALRMANGVGLAHNPGLAAQVPRWRAIGENVGRGNGEPVVQRALEQSPGHRANLLSTQFAEVGYGVAVAADGALYVDEIFRTPVGAPCGNAATSVQPATPRPAPALPARSSTYASAPTAPRPRDRSATAPAPAPLLSAPLPSPRPVPVTAAAIAGARLLAELRQPSAPHDVVIAVFTFHDTLANAVK